LVQNGEGVLRFHLGDHSIKLGTPFLLFAAWPKRHRFHFALAFISCGHRPGHALLRTYSKDAASHVSLTARFPLCYKRRSTVIVNAANIYQSASALASLLTVPVAEEVLLWKRAFELSCR